MPKLNGIDLPTVTVADHETLEAKIAREKFTPDQLVELAVYLKREREKVSVLDGIENTIKDKLLDYYEKMAPEHRESLRTSAGMATYTQGRETLKLRDRDATVRELTPEQLRVSYKPDMKALETILPEDQFDKLVERSRSARGIVTVRDTRGEFEELDF